METIYIITGGTTVPITPHFSLSSKAYGKVGTEIYDYLNPLLDQKKYDVVLVETAMCGPDARTNPILKNKGFEKGIETVDDLSRFVDNLIEDPTTRGIIMSAAICDFVPFDLTYMKEDSMFSHLYPIDGENKNRIHKADLVSLKLKPSEKIINKIRKERKDIFLVSFKTTSGETKEELYKRSLDNLKGSSSNLVFGNDIENKFNMITTPEEFPYYYDTRDNALEQLAKMVSERLELTFKRTKLINGSLRLPQEENTPTGFVEVLKHIIDRGAFKEFNGKTTGHFGCKLEDGYRLASVRKVNHNKVFEEGMVKVYEEEDVIVAEKARASVGEHTQSLIYEMLGDKADSIVHFHSPLKENVDTSFIPTASQFGFECGSNECAINCRDNMKEVEDGIWAVHLEGHGPNIAFSEETPYEDVIRFIDRYWDLTDKTGGLIK